MRLKTFWNQEIKNSLFWKKQNFSEECIMLDDANILMQMDIEKIIRITNKYNWLQNLY